MTTASTTLKNPSALQRHASFFDPKGTREITFAQTYDGMKRVGVPFVLRALLTPVINGLLGPLTSGGFSLVIKIDTIAQGKHPYDSGSFDDGGAFDEAAFDALFANAGEAITLSEMRAVVTARGDRLKKGRIEAALGHWFSSREIGVLFLVAADTRKTVNGKQVTAMKKETLRSFYDGTLFFQLEQRRAG